LLAAAAFALLAAASVATAAERRVVVADPAPPPAAGPLTGYLTAPAGVGPFPAVALIHSCLGLPQNRAAFAATLASWGYVALYVDEFAPRGLHETSARPTRRRRWPIWRVSHSSTRGALPSSVSHRAPMSPWRSPRRRRAARAYAPPSATTRPAPTVWAKL
jgi:dienelactone hydrolase